MAFFNPKTWKQRIVEFPGRRRLDDTSTADVYDVSRAEGTIMQEGDGFTATNMNDLEQRIKSAIDQAETAISSLNSSRALVTIDMSSAQINTDFSVPYPEGFDRGNCFVIGVSGLNKNYGVWYGYMNYENIKVILATNITVNTSDDAFVGEGAKIKVLLEKAIIL